MRRARRRLTACALAFVLACAAAPAAASAAFPGRGGLIAFTDRLEGRGEAIFTVDRKGRGRTALTDPGGLTDTDPAWSADGSQLAFTRIISGTASRVMITSSFGTPPRTITPDDAGLIESEPGFSPDGSRIVFRGRPSGSSFLSGDDEIYSIGLDGTGLTALTSTPGEAVQEPAFSPDGRRIAYSSAPARGGSLGPADVLLLNLASGESSLVTQRRPKADDDDPSWRPDGKRLVYERERSKGPDDLATIRPSGKNSRLMLRAPKGAEYRDPGYSPSGRKVALHMARGNRFGIAVYDPKRKKLRYLVDATENESDWQPRP